MLRAIVIRRIDMPRKKNKNKKKKEKIVWYDDNSTIADMSAVSGKRSVSNNSQPKPHATFKEKWNTYWSAVRMMLLPTIVVLGVIAVLYIFMMLLTGGFSK